MSEFITLTCPSCGGKLQITYNVERFACANCGNEHLVKRQGGAIFLTPVVETLQHIQVGTDKTASELAISRLKSEIDEIEKIKREVKDVVIGAMKDPAKFSEIKDILASRRKSFLDKLKFKESVDPNACIREIQGLSSIEFDHLRGNITFNMIRINLETLKNFESMIQDKRNQLSQHQKVVKGNSVEFR
jgi:ribosomal protein S27E